MHKNHFHWRGIEKIFSTAPPYWVWRQLGLVSPTYPSVWLPADQPISLVLFSLAVTFLLCTHTPQTHQINISCGTRAMLYIDVPYDFISIWFVPFHLFYFIFHSRFYFSVLQSHQRPFLNIVQLRLNRQWWFFMKYLVLAFIQQSAKSSQRLHKNIEMVFIKKWKRWFKNVDKKKNGHFRTWSFLMAVPKAGHILVFFINSVSS